MIKAICIILLFGSSIYFFLDGQTKNGLLILLIAFTYKWWVTGDLWFDFDLFSDDDSDSSDSGAGDGGGGD